LISLETASREPGAPPKRARRLLVVFNPTAGNRSRRKLAAWLTAATSLGAVPEVAETTHHGHAMELARSADPARFDAVVAAGGDGTINDVINGLAQSEVPLAILPLGTANVLAAELGLPRRVGELARIAAFAPASVIWPGELLAPGTGTARRFLLMAGVGFDAAVVERIDLAVKRRTGRVAYAASILGRLRDYHHRPCRAIIDGVAVEPASLIVSRARFYGGRYLLAPTACLSEKRLDVVLFERSGRRAAVAYLASLLCGTLARRRDVRILSAVSLELIGPAGAPVQVDGDICARLPIALRVAETPLRVIVGEPPPSASPRFA
jgi:YegS/Rv2252/BmrU family lipid kinase